MDEKEVMRTSLFFISHASVLLRHGEWWILTDPWYESPAFTTWYPSPPPALSIDVLAALGHTNRLIVVISHAHPDHADPAFLRRLPSSVPIVIPRYDNDHLSRLVAEAGCRNVIEIDEGVTIGPWNFRQFMHHESKFDAAISIEADDCFVFHGNDAWTVGGINVERLRHTKPDDKPSLFMGQGGSASGYPLTYRMYQPRERVQKLIEKNHAMLQSIERTARKFGFDRALAYACFASVVSDVCSYDVDIMRPHGTYANTVTRSNLFIDMSPGDVYLFSEDRVIPVASSLHLSKDAFPRGHQPRMFPQIGVVQWRSQYETLMAKFLDGLVGYITQVDNFECALRIRIKVEGIATYERYLPPGWNGRTKTCFVRSGVMAAVLDRTLPFEDLYTGYLADWSRDPPDIYNRALISELISFGYAWLERDDLNRPGFAGGSEP